jgi:phage head maturation protease
MEILEFDDLTAATFAVDDDRRTIRGVVVPWGRIGRHRGGRKWRFARGSLKYSDVKYIKFNNDHDQAQRFGRAILAEDSDAGLVLTFKVQPGKAGDRALALAKEGSKTGLSVEVDIDTADTESDPENLGTLLVNMANLTGVGFVKDPAFTDSRVISVTASADGKDTGMPEEITETVPAEQPVTLTAEQFSALMGRVTAPAPAEVPATVTPPPAEVDPAARPVVSTQVSEALPYRFSYTSGRHVFAADAQYDFSTDVFALINGSGDAEAEKRVNGMIAAAFDVDTTDTAALSPNKYRPDLWQPQMDYSSPLWDMINSGSTGPDVFTVPKYNSSSGLVGPATEGVEPLPGAMTVTDQNITPTQVWGKVEITRQAARRGGSPQFSGILWDQMLREYVEDREAAVATFLNTLTAATDIALGTADGDSAGIALEAAIAGLQFVRGGNRFTAFAVHQDLYEDLAAARAEDGRPMYPQIGPSNANGTAASLFRYMDIAGTRAVPSWALGAPGSASVNSWLFDPTKVRGWASAPERLDWNFGATVQGDPLSRIPQLSHVTIGIYGDIALANLDINGVRQVTYDPVS